MHRVLINNYNATVGPEDLCYFLGDIGLGKGDLIPTVVQQLNGTKVCILGNHDKGATAMHRYRFDVVLNMAAMVISNKMVTMTHCPLRGVWREDISHIKNTQPGENWHGENKNVNFSVPDFGQYHLHGHIHSGPANVKAKIQDRQFDVGVCANDYRPVSISTIESWIAKREKEDKK